MAKSPALQESALGLNIQTSNEPFDSRYLDEDDIIAIERMRRKAEMKKRDEYYAKRIYEPYQGKDGAWYTYLPDEKKAGNESNEKLKRKSKML